MPQNYLLEEEAKERQGQALATFDRQMVGIKVPTILLERLKKEFDDSND